MRDMRYEKLRYNGTHRPNRMQKVLAPRSTLLASKRGQAALSLIFVIGGIVFVIGITTAFVVTSFLQSTYGFEAANRALAVAGAGVGDAFLQLIRNKDFSSSGYSIPVGEVQVNVTVAQASGKATITAQATVARSTRKVQAVVSINSTTGEITLLSQEELPL